MNSNPSIPRDQPLVARLGKLTRIKQFGAGGTGGIVARYGLPFVAAQSTLEGVAVEWTVVDGDNFETRNSSRMLFSSLGNKAEVICDDMLPHIDQSLVTLLAIDEFLTPENIERLIREGDIVLLCVDNHATRKLVSDYCDRRLREFCVISAGNDAAGVDESGRMRRGTYGNCQVFVRGRVQSPSLTQFHPEIRQPADQLPTDIHCTQLLASQPQLLFANLAAASTILNALWLYLCESLHYSELAFDIADGCMRPLPLPPPLPQPGD